MWIPGFWNIPDQNFRWEQPARRTTARFAFGPLVDTLGDADAVAGLLAHGLSSVG